MSLTRRGFLRHTVVVGPVTLVLWTEADALWAQGGVECTLPKPPQAKQFVPNEPKVVKRISTVEIAQPANATQLDQFRKAIGQVRALPDDDVIGWKKLIAQHCLNCAPSNASNIHYDWQFLPWHRALLYFLERNMRTLSKNNDLRLIYWPWEDKNSRVLPPIYGPTGQPLYWNNRGDLKGPWWPLTDPQVDVQGLLALPDFRSFGGTNQQRNPVPMSFGGPHANVHNNFRPGGDMRDLQYSPRDPVFYAHHSNIDRLWSSWAAISGHTNPDFGDAKVYFYDEQRVWSYVLMNDLRDTRKLGYEYSTLMKPVATQASLQAFVMPPLTRGRMQLQPKVVEEVNQEGEDFLALENIRNPEKMGDQVLDFGIFVGKPAAGTDSHGVKTFLGKASRVLSGAHVHPGPISAVLRVTGKLAQLVEKDQTSVELTIAPLDPDGKTTAEAVPLEADKITVIT